jgi:hypothetical protein
MLQPIELKGSVDADTVLLTWRHYAGTARNKYTLLRAQSDATKPACTECPMIFQMVGTLNVDRDTEVVEFKDQVPAGFIYTYKVHSVGSSGDRGPASNSVVIDRSKQ